MRMASYLWTTITSALLATTVSAHDYGNEDRRRKFDGPSRYHGGGTYAPTPSPVAFMLRDIESIARRTRAGRHEAKHFRAAFEDLRAFDMRMQRGQFDRRRLNGAIRNLEHLAQARQLHPRDRWVLRGHLSRLYRIRSGGPAW
jgi:hypothetical protein